MYQTPSPTPPRPRRPRSRRRFQLRTPAGVPFEPFVAAGLLVAVAAALLLSGGSGRPVELVLVAVAAGAAFAFGWPASGHLALAAGAAYLILETVWDRLDARHALRELALTAAILLTVLVAGLGRRGRKGRRRGAQRGPAPALPPPDPLGPWLEQPRDETEAWTPEAGQRLTPGTLDYEIERSRRHQRPLSILVIRPDELDFLAAVGAEGLTRLLDLIAVAVEGTLRSIDVVDRRGESRFEIVLPETDSEGARTVAERIRLRIDSSRPETTPGRPLGLSVSIGVAAYPADGTTAPELAVAAERALGRAVELGGNRTVLHSLPAGAPRGWALSQAERHLLSGAGPGARARRREA